MAGKAVDRKGAERQGAVGVTGRLGRGLAAVILCALLSACALAKLGEEKPAPATFDLVLSEAGAGSGGRLPLQLAVSEPSAVHALAGDGIMVRPAADSITYFGGTVWSDQLPRLVQARLVQTIEHADRFTAVGDGHERLQPDLELITVIEAFQVEVSGHRAEGVVTLTAKVADVRSGRVVASKGFTASAPATDDSPRAGVESLNAAAGEVLPAVARWVGVVAGKVGKSG